MLAKSNINERFAARIAPDGMDAALRMQLAAASRRIAVEREEPVRLDESCDQLVYIAQGATKLVAYASQGREQIVAFHFSDDLVCVPARATHAYSLVALTPATLLAMSLDKVLELAAGDAEIMRNLLVTTNVSLARCREKSITLGRKTAPERVASFLVTMADRAGTREGTSVLVPLPMSRRDIADSLGITIETVSRQITRLRDTNVIETIGRSQIRILDPGRLWAGAGFLTEAK
ncbi:helix-turn-helix domain-containing protein [Qipengyuania zhejiangensis]|uniref:helix-turn-helix domain-containing protein n=1 Tax=Qipengyuania zhejiangensis TaxID=3077782 RepID=UPI002D79F96D|nr:helix-turn-helix domain-containing protein [Qipengyuania sp. Z2]